MTTTGRRRAFLLVTVAVSSAAVVAVFARPESARLDRTPDTSPTTADPRHRQARPPKRPHAVHPHPPDTRSGRRAREHARALARDFLGAYLAYEARPTESRARKLVSLALPGSPARALLKTPPRVASDTTRGQVVLLELHGPYRRWLKASAIVRYGHRRLLLELILTRARNGEYRIREVTL